MINVSADPKKPPTVFTMGLGSVVVANVVNEGMPGLYFCAADKPGLVDADATDEVAGRAVAENAVIIRFSSMEAVMAHLERMQSMMKGWEAEMKARREAEHA